MIDFNATIIAQVLNFLFLVFILAKFAYKPVINMMEDRKNKIASDLENAELAKAEAEKLKLNMLLSLLLYVRKHRALLTAHVKLLSLYMTRLLLKPKQNRNRLLLPLKTQLLLKNSRLSAKYVLRLSNLVWLLPVKSWNRN